MNFINLIATKGTSPNCHFVFVDNLPVNSKPLFDEIVWQRVHAGMREAIYNNNGTGKKSDPNIDGVNVYGKTGTAENPHGDNHAWFVGWADYQNRKFSLVILLENAGSGGKVAAPLAKKIFSLLADNKILTLRWTYLKKQLLVMHHGKY